MSQPPEQFPRRNFATGRWIGRLLLRLLGWRIRGELPAINKAILVVAPHTSNWDWVVGMAAALTLDLDAHWLGKHTLFHGPFRKFLIWLGGIPVNRSSPEGVIDQVVAVCDRHPRFLLGIAPEGTRRPVAHWKTGCWRIARGAGMPLLPIAFDFQHREVAILEPFLPSDEVERDMRRLADCFSASMAKVPAKFLPHSRRDD